jgi:hypothetical protein
MCCGRKPAKQNKRKIGKRSGLKRGRGNKPQVIQPKDEKK